MHSGVASRLRSDSRVMSERFSPNSRRMCNQAQNTNSTCSFPIRRDQRALRSANRTPLIALRLPRFPARALVTSGLFLAHRRGGGLPSAAWQRRSGCAASLISFRLLRLRFHATKATDRSTERPARERKDWKFHAARRWSRKRDAQSAKTLHRPWSDLRLLARK